MRDGATRRENTRVARRDARENTRVANETPKREKRRRFLSVFPASSTPRVSRNHTRRCPSDGRTRRGTFVRHPRRETVPRDTRLERETPPRSASETRSSSARDEAEAHTVNETRKRQCGDVFIACFQRELNAARLAEPHAQMPLGRSHAPRDIFTPQRGAFSPSVKRFRETLGSSEKRRREALQGFVRRERSLRRDDASRADATPMRFSFLSYEKTAVSSQSLHAPRRTLLPRLRPPLRHLVRDEHDAARRRGCLLYTSPSPRDQRGSRMPSSA